MDGLESMHRIRALKLELARIDPRGGMPIAPPAGASEASIAGVERRLGFPLPPSYRALLALHDGVPQFFAGASLLGVRALTRGNFASVACMVMEGWDEAEAGDPEAPRDRRGARRRLIPFGIDAEAETIFAWDVDARRADGEIEVILWTNDIGVRLGGFPELAAMVVEMLTAELDERRRNAAAAMDLTPRLPAVAVPRRRPRATAVPVSTVPQATFRSWALG